MIKEIYYWLYIIIFGIPCRQQLLDILIKSRKPLASAIREVAIDYASGYNIETLSYIHSITRERVRQYLFKAVR